MSSPSRCDAAPAVFGGTAEGGGGGKGKSVYAVQARARRPHPASRRFSSARRIISSRAAISLARSLARI
tara:strand:+ start:181 stop:387 length:207 start_codon:yes stop_codon:yes gene_type:complete